MLKPTPGLVDEYFNGSTGDGAEGDTDMRGPWTTAHGLKLVESQMNGGKGLSVEDVDGKIGGEDRGKQDEAQKATTSPGRQAIGKKAKAEKPATRKTGTR
jgi:Mn-containing catalase